MIDISSAVYGSLGTKSFAADEETLIPEEEGEVPASYTSPTYCDPPAVVGTFKDGDAYAVKFCNGGEVSVIGSPCSAKTPDKLENLFPLIREQNPHICVDTITPYATTVLEPTLLEFVPSVPPYHMGGRKNANAFLSFLNEADFDNDGTLIIIGGGSGRNYGPFLPYLKSKIYWCDPILPIKSSFTSDVHIVKSKFQFPDLDHLPRPFYIFSDVATGEFAGEPDDETYSKVVIQDLLFHNKLYEKYSPRIFDHKFRVPTVDFPVYCGVIHSVPWGTVNEKRMRLVPGIVKTIFDYSEFRMACRQAVVKSRGLCAGSIFPFHDHCWNCAVESKTLVNFAEKFNLPVGLFGKKFSTIFKGRAADSLSRPNRDSGVIKTIIDGVSVSSGPLVESRYKVLREVNDTLKPHLKDFGLSKSGIASTLFQDVVGRTFGLAERLVVGKNVVDVQTLLITKKHKMHLHPICSFSEAVIFLVNSSARIGVMFEKVYAKLVLGAGHYVKIQSTVWTGGVVSLMEPVKVGTEMVVIYTK